MNFYFEYGNSRIVLPINPGELEIPNESKNETVDVITSGGAVIPGNKELMKLKIKSFFPKYDYFNSIDFREQSVYINFFKQIMNDKKPVKVIIEETEISNFYVIEKFNTKLKGGTYDIEYELELIEYKPLKVKMYKLENTVTPYKETQRTTTTNINNITTGAKVIVNGQLFRDSYGNGAGKVLNNFTGIVSIIKTGRIKPYHITNLDGGWLGWVAQTSIKQT